MTVGRLIKLLEGADFDADVTVWDANPEDCYSIGGAHIQGVTINNNGSAYINFNLNISDRDLHGEKAE